MLTRILAAAAFATLSAAAAQAGSLQGDQWTPSSACKDPGAPPVIADKNPDAYNKSVKVVPEWQAAYNAYGQCLNAEAKADQSAIVSSANAIAQKLNDEGKALQAASDAAIAKLKSAKK
jgi:hypothetical protein